MKWLKNLNSGGFLKSFTVLASGSFVSQIILAISELIIVRIFNPALMGIYNALIAFPTAFVGVICARYDMSIVYEEDENNVFPLMKLNLTVTLIIGAVITIANGIYMSVFRPEYIQYLYLLPAIFIYLLAYGLTGMLNAYNSRYREFKLISRMHVVRTAAQSLGTIILGLIFVAGLKWEFLSVPILVIPYCVGMLCGAFTQAKSIRENWHDIMAVSPNDTIRIAKKHKKQPLLSSPAIFANNYSYSLITMQIDKNYGETATGLYSISSRLLGMPLALISGNIAKVFMERASKEYSETGGFRKAFKKTFLFLFVLSIPMWMVMYFFASPICAFFLGQEWVDAGSYIRILSFMFAVRFIATAISVGLLVCRKQGAEIILQASLLGVTALAGVLTVTFSFSIAKFLMCICVFRSLVMIAQIVTVYIYSELGIRKYNKEKKQMQEQCCTCKTE